MTRAGASRGRGVSRERPKPAGRFSAWLRETLTAHATDIAVDVPCGDCVACCTSSYFIHIRPDERRTFARVPRELLVPAPGAPQGHVVMGYDHQGRCPMLRGGRCSIYEDRPLTCRTYDCRVFAAAGIDADRPAITRRARAWAFGLPTDDDRRELAAVRTAAGFVQEHPESFRGGAQADIPAHVALLAVKVHEVFLGTAERGGTARAATEAPRLAEAERSAAAGGGQEAIAGGEEALAAGDQAAAAEQETVAAVLAAFERFEAGRSAHGRSASPQPRRGATRRGAEGRTTGPQGR